MSPKPYMVGVCGGSASGKTFLLRNLTERYPDERLTLVSQDNYYFDRDKLPRDEDGQINFDHPEAMDHEGLYRDLQRLAAGEAVSLREYTFNNPEAPQRTITYRSAPIIIVEGIFIFHDQRISELLDLRLFVDADEHIRLSRRIRRDFEERGYGLDDVLDYYEKFVVPMYRKYVQPHRDECDLIIPNNRHMDRALKVVTHHFDAVLS